MTSPGNDPSEVPPSGKGEGEARTFVIGITMAGAVSAGAYTAGVLDFLIRALEAHNARVDDTGRTGPRHRVALKVMSGASAGGVCAALGLVGLIKNRDGSGAPTLGPAKTVGAEADPYHYSYVLDPVHEVWVDGLDLWNRQTQSARHRRDGAKGTGLLAIEDIRHPESAVLSLLNGHHVDRVADAALGDIEMPGTEGDALAGYDFLARDLEIFLTATNLSGVPYRVGFRPGLAGDGASGHAMAQHAAVRHFRVSGLGTRDIVSNWLARWHDVGIELPLPPPGRPLPVLDPGTPWGRLRTAAIATGAFPIGLAARQIECRAEEFGRFGAMPDDARTPGGAMPVDVAPEALRHARPDFGDRAQPGFAVRYVAVDGGLMNNEPFEYARYTIRPAMEAACEDEPDRFLRPNPRRPDKADRAVIMIDPFPEGPEYEQLEASDTRAGRALLPVIGALVPALKNQARFKPSELLLAASEEVHSRFLIAPRRGPRSDASGPAALSGAEAIASGGLGGFLGFFDKRFRMHDFMLGQRNCQRFIAEHFTLSEENGVLGIPEDAHTGKPVPILQPGPGLMDREVPLPPWPAMDNGELEPLLDAATRRLGLLGKRLVGQQSPNAWLSFALERLWSMTIPVDGIKATLREHLIRTVLRQLVAREQHVSSRGAPLLRRRVLAVLIEQGPDRQTADEIARSVLRLYADAEPAPDTAEVARELARLVSDGHAWTGGALLGKAKFLHRCFRPSWLKAARILLTG